MTPRPLVVSASARASAAPPSDSATEHETLGPSTGFGPLRQAVLRCADGQSLARTSDDCEEVLFVLAGAGTLELGGEPHALKPESGAYLAPGESYVLRGHGPDPLVLIRVRIPAPEPGAAEPGPRTVVRRLADQEAQGATTEREFRVVADPSCGLRAATHFVGYIPTARAPEHFHTYDEVIYVLEGEGVFSAGELHEPLGPGSCVQLPARTVHCLENTGPGTMRVVAVFRPAGSPAAAYYPDGTAAHADAAPIHV